MVKTISDFWTYVTLQGVLKGEEIFNFSLRTYIHYRTSTIKEIIEAAYKHFKDYPNEDHELNQFLIEFLWYTIEEYMLPDIVYDGNPIPKIIYTVKKEYKKVTKTRKLLKKRTW